MLMTCGDKNIATKMTKLARQAAGFVARISSNNFLDITRCLPRFLGREREAEVLATEIKAMIF